MKSFLVLILVASAAAILTFVLLKSPFDRGQGATAGNDGILKTEQDFRDRLAELRMQRDKHENNIKRLQIKKQETMDFLVKEKGIRSSSDIPEGDTSVRYALRELQGWKSEIETLESDLPKYDDAISSIEAMLSEIERRQISDEVALTKEDLIGLQKIVVDLNERLGMDKRNPLEDKEIFDLFDSEVEGFDGE